MKLSDWKAKPILEKWPTVLCFKLVFETAKLPWCCFHPAMPQLFLVLFSTLRCFDKTTDVFPTKMLGFAPHQRSSASCKCDRCQLMILAIVAKATQLLGRLVMQRPLGCFLLPCNARNTLRQRNAKILFQGHFIFLAKTRML